MGNYADRFDPDPWRVATGAIPQHLFTQVRHSTVQTAWPQSEAPSDWLDRIANRLNFLASLPAGWDSYGARPVDYDAITNALRLISIAMSHDGMQLPQLVATPHGGIQLEWLGNRGDLEIAVEPEGISVFLDVRNAPDRSFERNIQLDELSRELRGYIDTVT